MAEDYYAVLGVAASADVKAIHAAFRQRAKQCHPDRGGSHELMKRLNEAYAILSNSETRRHYDQQRAGQLQGAEANAFQEEVKSAHAQAESYPAQWEDFVRWQEGLAADFAKADYDAGWGAAFIYLGGFLGVCWAIVSGLPWIVGAMLGIFGGQAAHYLVGRAFGYSATISRAALDANAPANAKRAKPQQPSSTRIIPCGRCGRKLRLPRRSPRVTVKCPACKYHFDYAPTD